MAQRVQVILEDDLDGSEASGTYSFAFDGIEYEIDLSTENFESLSSALAPWTAHARRVGGRRRRAGAKPVAVSNGAGSATSDIRAWAQEQGYEVSSRGRVSSEIREAYEAAHN
jgi:hypothetical protein